MFVAISEAPDQIQALRLANIGGEMNSLCDAVWGGEHDMGLSLGDGREPGLEYAVAQRYGISGMGDDHPLTAVATQTLNQVAQPNANILQTIAQGATQYLTTLNAKKDAARAARTRRPVAHPAMQQSDGGGFPEWDTTTWLLVGGCAVAAIVLISYASKR